MPEQCQSRGVRGCWCQQSDTAWPKVSGAADRTTEQKRVKVIFILHIVHLCLHSFGRGHGRLFVIFVI